MAFSTVKELFGSANFLLLGVCFSLGMLLRVFRRLPKEAPLVLNSFVFYVPLPALILLQIHQVTLEKGAFLPVLSAWIIFGLSWVLITFVGKSLNLGLKSLGALILTAGLGNTSFVGFPLLEALFGSQALKTGILIDQLGSFLVLSTLGILVASIYAIRGFSFKKMLIRIFSFPPLYFLVLAFFLRPYPYSKLVTEVLTRLSQTLSPLVLVSIGFQFKLDIKILKKYFIPLVVGLGYKLILGPLICLVIFRYGFQIWDESIKITIVESAMAPMITAAILSSEFELDLELANLMVGLGIPMSFLTVPIWYSILNSF